MYESWNPFFDEIWIRKWSQNGAQKPPKMKPKSIEIMYTILLIFWLIFVLFLEAPAEARTLDLIGRGETFMGPSLFDQDPKNHSKWVPKWLKNPPKIKPESNKKCYEILNRFWMDFGCILEAKFNAFGNQNGIKKGLKNQWILGCIFGTFLEGMLPKNFRELCPWLSPAECAGCLDSEFA